MSDRLRAINVYLFFLLLVAGVCGCRTHSKSQKYATLSLHLEARPDGTDRVASIPIYRSHPTMVSVEKSPFLDQTQITRATLVEVLGSYALHVQFNPQGRQQLETMSTAYRGRRVAVFSEFNKESRWLAAPIINQRITNGVFAFTPDCTMEETREIAAGLNRVAKKLHNAQPVSEK